MAFNLFDMFMVILAMLGATMATELDSRAVGPAQAPGLLPVNCYAAHDYTSDFTVKSFVQGICKGYSESPPIPAHVASVQNTYIINGTLQFKIENNCEHDVSFNAGSCALEFNSIAYGCTDNGRFYNGSSAYGCVNFIIQVFNASVLVGRQEDPQPASDPRMLCEFAIEGQDTVPTADLKPYIQKGCHTYDNEVIPLNKTFKFWQIEDDGTVIVFKLHNNNGTEIIGTEASCLAAFDFIADHCGSPGTQEFYHGSYRLDHLQADIRVYPNGTDALHTRELTARNEGEITCLPYTAPVNKYQALSAMPRACQAVTSFTHLDPKQTIRYLWEDFGGTMMISFTNLANSDATVSPDYCLAGTSQVISTCSASDESLFGRGYVDNYGIRYQVELVKNGSG